MYLYVVKEISKQKRTKNKQTKQHEEWASLSQEKEPTLVTVQ